MENIEIIEMKLDGNDICEDHKLGKTISEIDQQVCENVVISINKILEESLPRVNPKFNTIYQVSKELREMKDKAYTPQFISIGPFHHRTRNDLTANEHYKVQGFINFLRRININNKQIESSKELVEKCHGWMKEAWNCYAEPIMMKEEEFVLMMLVDACFILEIFILLVDQYGVEVDDKFFQIQDNVDFSFYQGIFNEILVDLIKLENQVPFFLLQNLFDLIPKHDVPKFSSRARYNNDGDTISLIDITNMILKELGFVNKYRIKDLYHKEPKHLLHFLSFYFLIPLPPNDDHKQNKQDQTINNLLWLFFDLLCQACLYLVSTLCCFCNKVKVKWIKSGLRKSPPSITELYEAGVIIKAGKRIELSIMDISFKNGILEIPCIDIDSTFEVMIRNVIAFDHYPAGNKEKYAIQYVLFLDDLINTEQDAHLLAKKGVIINTFGGSDKDISELFNSLSKFVIIPYCFHFERITNELRYHCQRGWNKSKASLKHNYFNTPWAIISFVAATFLIILTILQTIFSAISTFPS